MKMKTIEQVAAQIRGRLPKEKMIDRIHAAFDGYEYEGVEDVIITSPNMMNCYDLGQSNFSAYVNHADAPEIRIKWVGLDKYGDYGYLVVSV